MGAEIEFDCDDDFILIGSQHRICEPDGEWTGDDIDNDCIGKNGLMGGDWRDGWRYMSKGWELGRGVGRDIWSKKADGETRRARYISVDRQKQQTHTSIPSIHAPFVSGIIFLHLLCWFQLLQPSRKQPYTSSEACFQATRQQSSLSYTKSCTLSFFN